MVASYLFIVVTLAVISQRCYGEDIDERIYNGNNATSGQFPYQALLNVYNRDGDEFLCGGSLISRIYVLTAAHCVYGDMETVKVTLGVTQLNDMRNAVVYLVNYQTNVRPHPNYNPRTTENDIAIIKLPQMVTITKFIQAVTLPKLAWSNPDYFVNARVTASGFGRTYDDDENTPHYILKYANQVVMPVEECKPLMKHISVVADGELCTYRGRQFSGTCAGDSGGPLVIRLQSVLYLIGVVSWGEPVCESKLPDVYTDVAYFLRWINKMTNISIS